MSKVRLLQPVQLQSCPQQHDPAPSGSLPNRRALYRAVAGLALIGLLLLNRRWLGEAIALVQTAHAPWLFGSFGLILLSYLASAQVFNVVLRTLGQRISVVRLWLTTVTAIVISQCIPAGGVGSYAFLLRVFNRRGVSSPQAALLAALEGLSYVGAMLLIGVFSGVYLIAQPLTQTGNPTIGRLLLAGGIGCLGLTSVIWVISRPAATLMAMLTRLVRWLPHACRPGDLQALVQRAVAELVRNRDLVAARPWLMLVLVLIQLVALSGHSLALCLVLHSLGVPLSFPAALAAFGVALITSTFNLLPGGGGTVETMLVAVLLQLGVGPTAIPAAILFRLLNFWVLLPVAGGSYVWLMRQRQSARPGAGSLN